VLKKAEKGKLSERIGRNVLGLRQFIAMIARLPTFLKKEWAVFLFELYFDIQFK